MKYDQKLMTEYVAAIRKQFQNFLMDNAPCQACIAEADSYAEYFLAENLHFVACGYGSQVFAEIPFAHLAAWVEQVEKNAGYTPFSVAYTKAIEEHLAINATRVEHNRPQNDVGHILNREDYA